MSEIQGFPSPQKVSDLIHGAAAKHDPAIQVAAKLSPRIFTLAGMNLAGGRVEILSDNPAGMAVRVKVEVGGQEKKALQQLIEASPSTDRVKVYERLSAELSRLVTGEAAKNELRYDQIQVTVNKALEKPGYETAVTFRWREPGY